MHDEQVCWRASPLLMNSGPFVLDCQPSRRITAGYECVIIMSLQGRAKLSPSVFWWLPNCCPITETSAGPKLCLFSSYKEMYITTRYLPKQPFCYCTPKLKMVDFIKKNLITVIIKIIFSTTLLLKTLAIAAYLFTLSAGKHYSCKGLIFIVYKCRSDAS